MSKKVSQKTASELQAEADKMALELKKLRVEARKAREAEEAERKRIARQKEIDEAVALGRKAREVLIANVTVADFLDMTDAERQGLVGDVELRRQRDALLEYVKKTRTRSDGIQFSYWDNFNREHPGVFNT